ncbi:unnamed protein product, partial [marine sediment metagenome]
LEQDARESKAALDMQALDDERAAAEKALKEKKILIDQEKAYRDRAYKEGSKALRNLSRLMNSENRKAFEVGKAAAIADTTIKTAQSAMGAFNAMVGIPIIGPALGAAAAAAAVAYGATQISAINSTSFGGGGGGGGAGGPAVVSASDGGADAAPQQVTNVTEAHINVTGDGLGADGARALLSELRELQEDGAELVIK